MSPSNHFFAVPDFLELLQFWDASRAGRPVPDWSGDLAVIPQALLPNMTVSDRRGEATFLYVGDTVARRLGGEPTGKRIHGEVLSGAHSAYIRSVAEETMRRRAPIFSAAIYQSDPATLLMTGRLFAPMTYQGSAEPCMLLTLQLFHGSEQLLERLGLSSIVHEIRRDLIAMVPEVCAKLEDARRYYQLSRHTHQRGLSQHIDRIAQELAGSALVPLPCLDVPGA